MTFFKKGTELTLPLDETELYLSNLKLLGDRDLALFTHYDISFAKAIEESKQVLSLEDWFNDRSLIYENGVEKLLFFDTETAHLNGYAASIALILTDLEGTVIDELYLEINPGVKMDPEAIAIHKLTDEYLSDKPYFIDLEPQITTFINQADTVVAHNVKYDQGVLIREYQRLGIRIPDILNYSLDTMLLLKNQIKFDHVKRKNPKLSEAAFMLNIDLDNLTLHNALEDTRLMLNVYKEAIQPKTEMVLTESIIERFKNENK